MTRLVLKGDIFLRNKILMNSFLVVENGKVVDITTEYDGEYEDLTGYIIGPGFFDTHIHGFEGYDIMDLKPDNVVNISKNVVKMGVTSFLATTLTSSEEDLEKALSIVRDQKENLTGAKLKGVFLEGPFFTVKYKGAQNAKYMTAPNTQMIEELQKLSGGLIKKVAIAPEYENSKKFIKDMKKMGIYVALGHSDASYEEAREAVEAGANIFVHTYNGMSGLHHREPGMVGAAMHLKDSYSELICDGHHVHPIAANILIEAKGREKIALITDCMMAGGMPEGSYTLGEYEVDVRDGQARLESGSLAGSVLKLSDGVKNVVNWGAATIHEAIMMASYIPAKSVGLDDEIGVIDIGRSADIIVMDRFLNLVRTYVDGQLKYNEAD